MNNFEIDLHKNNNEVSFSSVDGDKKIDTDKVLDLLGKLEGAKETYQTYTTTGDGYGHSEQRGGDNGNSESVKILGMPPLVFAVVSLGIVLASGVAIVMIGKKA